ncbi:MAG TPA: cyclopropane-fatty-acyl-phospholipid synthase family protein [Plasticicumulans sp.]|uniref:SAM-dependent methyltransferase n=1 Tax=Plasticicumulans sp. TaxID=2307179 RepID=UPI000FAF4378|nr:cyclopropane-fatty-acyl-phospholipid synthase family protein [Plasticicumulans sp.]RTL06523.1 MAG: class I SAM-dependent methyltransferase [Xanthomonadales bacterium]HMW29376.1 cyclopropane-fatty-acyl-phospholipid synthase family protein [Plasticicumulans sp.]HMW43423.1 cyclopropane-fatty-acyl-phospholipid synthase family protein [Plasticicumulans sp.]HNE00277.1 cyclopropane-fatty-acyl-phospholipid synthase family protein [Plasticicumulans sp.]HNF66205.1 cyclopropane-fatty-acyl-phospholipid
MNEQTLPAAPAAAAGAGDTADRLLRRVVFQRLRGLARGRLILVDADGQHSFGPGGHGPQVRVEILDPGVWARIALRGTVGVGEAYVDGGWRADDLTALVRLFVLNKPVMDGMERGLARLALPLLKLWHWLHPNTRHGSRANIAAHYDLGNAFYQTFLDETLMYSCALFEHPGMSLAEASQAKNERICRKLGLRAGDHVLEIGTGWGGFALHAAGRHGCRVTTTTISREQYELARERVAAAGLGNRVTVLFEDYRELAGRYDQLVSIEMIEAVGHRWFDTYFRTCSRLLAPDGQMLLQAITIRDQEYARTKRSVDFIQRHVFPGGCLPSVQALADTVARVTDLRALHLEDIGPHYATTLRHWRERFLANLDRVRALGFDDTFLRLWEYYLAYCEGGFAERYLGTVQLLLAKPECRRAVLPS